MSATGDAHVCKMLGLDKLPDKAYVETHSFRGEHGPAAYCTLHVETKEQGLAIICNCITHPKLGVNVFWHGSDGRDTTRTVCLNFGKLTDDTYELKDELRATLDAVADIFDIHLTATYAIVNCTTINDAKALVAHGVITFKTIRMTPSQKPYRIPDCPDELTAWPVARWVWQNGTGPIRPRSTARPRNRPPN